MTELERYEQAIANRAAGKATLGDAVAIARGRPGPPAVPIRFAQYVCRVCGQPYDGPNGFRPCGCP